MSVKEYLKQKYIHMYNLQIPLTEYLTVEMQPENDKEEGRILKHARSLMRCKRLPDFVDLDEFCTLIETLIQGITLQQPK